MRFLLNIVLFFVFIPDLIICITDESNEDENLGIPVETETTSEYVSARPSCATRRQNSIVHEIRQGESNQFAFIAAIYSQQEQYLCSGTVIDHGLVITAAECLENSPTYVVLNNIKDKHDNDTDLLQITKIEKFLNNTINKQNNVGLIYFKDKNNSLVSKLKVSNYTNYKDITEFEALGFGLNAEMGQTKHLQYVGLENKIATVKGEVITGYLDCLDTKITTCFMDIGGPAIFDNEMIGIVVEGQHECLKEMTSKFAVDKYMVTVLPTYIFRNWLEDHIKKNNQQSKKKLATYPVKPTSLNKNEIKNKKPRRSSATSNIASPIALTSVMYVICFK